MAAAGEPHVLRQLAVWLSPDNLPTAIPFLDRSSSAFSCFLPPYIPNPDLLEEIEDEPSVFSAQVKDAFGWKSRTTGNGTLPILERSDGLAAVVAL